MGMRAPGHTFPAVADKSFLIHIGDRSVTGLVTRDQMVGPWQIPVADVAVTASGFQALTGEAMAMGERTPLAVINAPASGRMAIAESLTNLAAAKIESLKHIKISANWMAAAGSPLGALGMLQDGSTDQYRLVTSSLNDLRLGPRVSRRKPAPIGWLPRPLTMAIVRGSCLSDAVTGTPGIPS